MRMTNKTTIAITLGIFALAFGVGSACLGDEMKSVTISTVTPSTSPAVPVPPGAALIRPKFEIFNAANYTGETGKLILPCKGARDSVTLRKMVDGKMGDYLAITGVGSELIVPVGVYRLSNYYVTIRNADGGSWSISGSGRADDEASTIEVKAGQSLEIGTARQLQAAIKSGKTGSIRLPYDAQGSVTLRLVAEDQPETSLSVSGKGKQLTVPVGKYKLQHYNLSSADKNGPRWSISNGIPAGKDLRIIDVKPGGKIDLVSGSKEAASLKSGKTGTITPPFEGQSNIRLRFAEKTQTGDYLSVNGTASKFSIPAGDYEMQSCYSTVADKDNIKWSVTLSSAPGKTLTVKPGGDVKMAFKQPLTASVNAKQDGDKISMSLKMASGDGTPFAVRRADGKGDLPGFQVLNKSGDVVMSGKFAYG